MLTHHIDATCRIWGPGQLFAFSACDGHTDYERGLVLRSRTNGLQVLIPSRHTLAMPADAEITGFGCDWLQASSSAGPLSMAFVDACVLHLSGPWSIASSTADLIIQRRENEVLLSSRPAAWPAQDLAATIDARRIWADVQAVKLPNHPLVAKIVQMMKGQLCSPSGRYSLRWSTPDRWPHRDCWLWDTAFHAVGWRHIDPACAREQISALLERQAPSGFIAHCYAPESESDVTQPPILAWAVDEVLAIEDDEAWLAEVYPRLAAFMSWLLEARGREGTPLLHWLVIDDEHCPCPESGWDNSIRFHGEAYLDAVDLSAFASRDCALLARFATRLGHQDDAAFWQRRHEAINQAISNDLWEPSLGLFCDRDIASGERRPLRTPAGLLPLICGATDQAQRDQLKQLIQDPATFGSPMPLPSVAIDDQDGLPQADDMWCGPVWISINHQVIRGLQQHGDHELAARLQTDTLAGITRWHQETGVIFEYYDCHDRRSPGVLPRKGPNDPESDYHIPIHDFGWSATLALDLLCTENQAS